MPLELLAPHESLRRQTTHRRAICWRITRTDGEIVRFTNHNAALVFNSETFPPRGGFDATASRQESGLRAPNVEYQGMLSSDAITDEDLLAGRYSGARIDEMLVDWGYPWIGPMRTRRFQVNEIAWTPFGWQAQIVGLAERMQHDVGRVLTRSCDTSLGSDRCKVDLGPITESRTVDSVNSDMPNQDFVADVLDVTSEDDWYEFGVVTWTTGDNTGVASDVMRSLMDKTIRLETKTPFPIEVGDSFDIYPGCARIHDHCFGKFRNPDDPDNNLGRGNLDNFQGYPTIPGADDALAGP